MTSKSYWNRNLDTDNLSRPGGTAHADLEESFAFARTPEFEWLEGRIGGMEGKRLLDLGGGVGMHALMWAAQGARVIVADLAIERLRALRVLADQAGLGDRISFVVARGEELPFCERGFPVVFTKSVLIHTNLQFVMREIYRILLPGGQGIFIEPLNRNPIIRIYRRLFAPSIWKKITRYFDRDSLDEVRLPFGTVRWKGFYLLSAGSFFWQYGCRRLGRFQSSVRFWRRADMWILRRWPQLEWWCWFAAIEVRKPE
ncbi:class I SAM-dependent methyltransferase [bacterium]|nr:class I SAM-dependent methyltransferase [bacterium]